MSARPGPTRVDVVLAQVLEKHGMQKQVQRIGILELWPEIVGERVAGVTRVKGVDKEALLVEVRSSAWLMELSMLKTEVLERVNARLADAPLDRIVAVLDFVGKAVPGRRSFRAVASTLVLAHEHAGLLVHLVHGSRIETAVRRPQQHDRPWTITLGR